MIDHIKLGLKMKHKRSPAVRTKNIDDLTEVEKERIKSLCTDDISKKDFENNLDAYFSDRKVKDLYLSHWSRFIRNKEKNSDDE
jgi:hypothetical protein